MLDEDRIPLDESERQEKRSEDIERKQTYNEQAFSLQGFSLLTRLFFYFQFLYSEMRSV